MGLRPEAVKRKLGVARDRLSATPFFSGSSSLREHCSLGLSDFSLMDAIECGM
jgi:hypothetical protein